jgi:hypothetical protein
MAAARQHLRARARRNLKLQQGPQFMQGIVSCTADKGKNLK